MSCNPDKTNCPKGGIADANWSYGCLSGKLDCSLCKDDKCAKSNNLLTLHDKLLINNEALICGNLTACKDLCVGGALKACNLASGTLQVAPNSILPQQTNPFDATPVQTVSFNTICGSGSAVQPTSVISNTVNSIWKAAFALGAGYDDTQGAVVFTVPIEIKFDKPFPKCPTVVANLGSSSGEIFSQAAGSIVVSATTIVDDVTVHGATLRVQGSIVGGNVAGVNLFFRGLLSGGESQEPIRIGWIAYSQ